LFLEKQTIYSCSTAIRVGLLSVTFFQTMVPIQFDGFLESSSSISRRLYSSLSSMQMKMTPSSESKSNSSRKRGHIIAHHLSWRRPFSIPIGLDSSHSRIIGALTLSL